MDSPLAKFPDLNHELVHGGAAFFDETVELMQAHSNLYMTLETTFSYILAKPCVFAKILGRLVAECGSERLLFASGNNLGHPAPMLEAFANYLFPDEYLAEFHIKPLTDTHRSNILGLNALRLRGIDASDLLEKVGSDAFARRGAEGSNKPWSDIRRTVS